MIKLKPGRYTSTASKETKQAMARELRTAAGEYIKESDQKYRQAAKNMGRVRLMTYNTQTGLETREQG